MRLRFKLLAALLLFACAAHAQNKRKDRPSPEEHLKQVTSRLKNELSLNDEQSKKIEAAFKTFFEGMKELNGATPPPPPPPPPQIKKEDLEKLTKKRDEEIKKALSDPQFKEYLKLEKEMRPPHPPEVPPVKE